MRVSITSEGNGRSKVVGSERLPMAKLNDKKETVLKGDNDNFGECQAMARNSPREAGKPKEGADMGLKSGAGEVSESTKQFTKYDHYLST
jgi:hypothetical protein